MSNWFSNIKLSQQKEPWQMSRKEYEGNGEYAVNPHVNSLIENYGEGIWDRDFLQRPTDIWFHGTQADFNQFKTRGIRRYTKDWNSQLGIHFSDKESIADDFASGDEYGKRKGVPRVIKARLKIKNPKKYEDENSMAVDALQYGLTSNIITLKDLILAMNRQTPWSNNHWSNRIQSEDGLNLLLSQHAIVIMQNMAQKRPLLANNMRKMLQQQGYDGIFYKNMIEGGDAAIVFNPADIEQVQDRKSHIQHILDAEQSGQPVPPEAYKDYAPRYPKNKPQGRP